MQALESLMFATQKRYRRLKGWTCADGIKERDKHAKEEIAIPIVALESVCLASVTDAKEWRDSATLDLPNV